jgi:RNA-dependent RNA polymerase
VLAHNQESRDYKFAEEFGRTMGALKAQYKEICREAAGMTNGADWHHLGPFVAAMYTVTAREMQAALNECHDLSRVVGGQIVPTRLMDAEHMPLISFPWLFPSELGKIATGLARQVAPVSSLSPHVPHFLTHRKKVTGRNSGIEVGDVETEEGVVHYGELLKLNFDTFTEDQHRPAEIEEKQESGVVGEQSAAHAVQKSSVHNPFHQDPDTKDALRKPSNNGGGDKINHKPKEEKNQQDALEERKQQDGGLKVRLEGKKPSVFERLSRFA